MRRILRTALLVLLTLGLIGMHRPMPASSATGSVYVQGGQTLYEYSMDLSAQRSARTFAPRQVMSMIKHPWQNLIYVSTQGAGTDSVVEVLDAVTETYSQIPLGGTSSAAYEMTFSPDGTRLYVPLNSCVYVVSTNPGAPDFHQVVNVICTDPQEVIFSVATDSPGSTLFLGAYGKVLVYRLDTCAGTYQETQQIAATSNIHDLNLDPVHNKVFASDRGAPSFVISPSAADPGVFERRTLTNWPTPLRSWRGTILADGRRFIGADSTNVSTKTALVFDAQTETYLATVAVPPRTSYKYCLSVASNPTDTLEGYIGQAWCSPMKLFRVRLADVGAPSETLQLVGSREIPENAVSIVVIPE